MNERLTLDSRQMYQSIADADATITAAFLASPTPPLPQLQRYEADLATAHGDLSGLQAAGGSAAAVTALAQLGSGLSAYSGYVGEATAEYAMGYPLTGGSFLQVASEEAHLVLLPAANTVFTQENDALKAASGQATGLPSVIAALVLALVTAFAFYRAQRWLTRRTNRVLSPGLVLASLLLAVSVIWLAAGFVTARSDLDRGISHGNVATYDLAFASIGVQQIRGDAVLNVISRSGNASFQDDFSATSKKTGPGPGSWLSDAATAQGAGGQGASLVATAARDATAWYAANNQVYQLGATSNYAAERSLIVGSTATAVHRTRKGPYQGDRRRPGRLRLRRHGRSQRARPAGRRRDRRVPADGGRLRVGGQPQARGIPLSSLAVAYAEQEKPHNWNMRNSDIPA